MLSVLRNVTYRRLFTAQIVALIGTGLLTVALGLLAYDLAGSNAGAVLGTALTIKMLAYVGLAPVINALVARWPKKRVLIGADLIRAAMALCLPFISDVWQIYVVIFLLQSASATFTPAFQSLIPTILTDEKDYTRALSLSRLAYDMEALVSPAMAALLLTAGQLQQPLHRHRRAGSSSPRLWSRSPSCHACPPAAAPQAPLWHRTTLGARIFWRNRRLRSLLALNLVVAAPTALVLVNTVVYVRDVLHRPDTDLALALACFGVGSMIVALSAPRVLDRFGDRAVMLTGAAVIPFVLAGAAALTLLGAPGRGLVAAAGPVVPARRRELHDPHAVVAPAAGRVHGGDPAVRVHGPVLPLPCLLHPDLSAGRVGRGRGRFGLGGRGADNYCDDRQCRCIPVLAPAPRRSSQGTGDRRSRTLSSQPGSARRPRP